MKMTITLPDELYRRVQHAAAEIGLPVAVLVLQALKRFLQEPPLIMSRAPGSIKLTPEQIHEILTREELVTER